MVMEMLFIIAVIFFFIGFFSGKARAKYEENSGKQVVNNLLSKHFTNEEYHLLKNVTLPIADGTTQIDHVLVSTKGIFVIEKKDFSGWIFGNPKLPKWTQSTRWGKYKFQNPIHQNHKHIKELERYFDFLPDKSCEYSTG
jgi:Nuclease-related domain